MFRDKTPLVNLGYGITSRDIPASSNEEKNPNPNSGLISRALDDKPILKYITTAIATLAGTQVAAKMLSRGRHKVSQNYTKVC